MRTWYSYSVSIGMPRAATEYFEIGNATPRQPSGGRGAIDPRCQGPNIMACRTSSRGEATAPSGGVSRDSTSRSGQRHRQPIREGDVGCRPRNAGARHTRRHRHRNPRPDCSTRPRTKPEDRRDSARAHCSTTHGEARWTPEGAAPDDVGSRSWSCPTSASDPAKTEGSRGHGSSRSGR